MSGDRRPLSVLLVCDANICRSPAAQLVLEHHLPGARVESAGIRARDGAYPMCSLARAELAASGPATPDGIDAFARDFRSRPIGDADPDSFHLILTATRGLRGELARAYPHLLDRVFTIREAAVLVEGGVGTAASSSDPIPFVAALNAGRDGVPLPVMRQRLLARPVHPFDVPDEHGSSSRRHRSAIAAMAGAATTFAAAVRQRSIA